MPRRNNREPHEPLDVTPADVKPFRYSGRQPLSREREQREREAIARQRAARINNAIDWSVCLVPGCGKDLFLWGRLQHDDHHWRDHTVALPLCLDHLFVAHAMAKRDPNEPAFVDAAERLLERKATLAVEIHETKKREHLAREDGDIYFIRLGEMIKVGWTRDLFQRVKSYGASAELLVSYPGTRSDETNLHRQLRPALAKGREWYEDGKIIAAFIDEALAKYGMPRAFEGMWTQPKRIVAGKRHR